MILKRFIEKLTHSHNHHSFNHSSSLPEYSILNSEGSSQNNTEFSNPTARADHSKQNCRKIRRVSETAESFDDHRHPTDHQTCDSSCPCTDSDFKIDPDLDELHLHHDHNTHFFHKNTNHSNEILADLNKMRKCNQMFDVTLVCDNNNEINCHKAILVANSPYFMAMFSSSFMEFSSKKVKIQEIDPDSLSLIIDYMYTGEILITENNVQSLLATSNLLDMTSLKLSCGQFIESQLDVTNCLGIKEFADMHSCHVLLKYAEAFIEQYFNEIVQKDEFLSLNFEQLRSLVSKDTLAVSSEKIVYDSIRKWIGHDQENRNKYLGNLMKCVRFGLFSHDDLTQISQDSCIKNNILCMELITEALQYNMIKFSIDEVENSNIDPSRIRPRIPLGLPKVMFLFGGQAPKAISKVDVYDFRSQQWLTSEEMPTKRCRAGVAYFDKKIFIVGGFNGQTRTRSVDIYNPRTKEWTQGSEMICRRGTLGVGLLNRKIYAVGGFDGFSGLSSVECWSMKNNENWSMVAPMSTKRSSVGIAVLNNYLYAIGGYCGLSRECLDSVERYDPYTNKWYTVPSMTVRRSGACVSAFEGKIFVVGGHDGPQVLKCVEVFDPVHNHWEFIADLNVARRNASFVIHNGLFYVIGGDDGHRNLSSVEIYSPQRNVWSLLPSFMNEARAYSGCVVAENFS